METIAALYKAGLIDLAEYERLSEKIQAAQDMIEVNRLIVELERGTI